MKECPNLENCKFLKNFSNQKCAEALIMLYCKDDYEKCARYKIKAECKSSDGLRKIIRWFEKITGEKLFLKKLKAVIHIFTVFYYFIFIYIHFLLFIYSL